VKRILIVHNVRAVPTEWTAVLAEAGYSVTLVMSGKEAVIQLQQSVPDLLIASVYGQDRKDIDGFELMATVRRAPKLSHLPVLLLDSAKGAERAFSLSSVGGLLSHDGPVTAWELVSAVARIIGRPD
jgi:CheY-like chemotaxis protein